MKLKALLISFAIIISCLVQAQDYTLSQFNESPLLLNPANAGLLPTKLRANMNYRQQWRSIAKPFNTVVASADATVFSQGQTGSSLGAGIVLANDVAGTGKMNTLNASLAVMGKVMLNNKQMLSAGIIGGIMQRQFDYGSLTWTDQFDGMNYNPAISHNESMQMERKLSPDVGAGVQWSYGQGSSTLSSNDDIGAQVGISVYHLNKPNIGFEDIIDRRYMRATVHGSLSYGIKNTLFQLNPQFMLQMQGPSQMYCAGTYVKYLLQESSRYTGNLLYRSLNFGTFYRVGDAVILATQLEWDQYAFGISYDINISYLKKATRGFGSAELSIRYYPFKPSSGSRLL